MQDVYPAWVISYVQFEITLFCTVPLAGRHPLDMEL